MEKTDPNSSQEVTQPWILSLLKELADREENESVPLFSRKVEGLVRPFNSFGPHGIFVRSEQEKCDGDSLYILTDGRLKIYAIVKNHLIKRFLERYFWNSPHLARPIVNHTLILLSYSLERRERLMYKNYAAHSLKYEMVLAVDDADIKWNPTDEFLSPIKPKCDAKWYYEDDEYNKIRFAFNFASDDHIPTLRYPDLSDTESSSLKFHSKFGDTNDSFPFTMNKCNDQFFISSQQKEMSETGENRTNRMATASNGDKINGSISCDSSKFGSVSLSPETRRLTELATATNIEVRVAEAICQSDEDVHLFRLLNDSDKVNEASSQASKLSNSSKVSGFTSTSVSSAKASTSKSPAETVDKGRILSHQNTTRAQVPAIHARKERMPPRTDKILTNASEIKTAETTKRNIFKKYANLYGFRLVDGKIKDFWHSDETLPSTARVAETTTAKQKQIEKTNEKTQHEKTKLSGNKSDDAFDRLHTGTKILPQRLSSAQQKTPSKSTAVEITDLPSASCILSSGSPNSCKTVEKLQIVTQTRYSERTFTSIPSAHDSGAKESIPSTSSSTIEDEAKISNTETILQKQPHRSEFPTMNSFYEVLNKQQSRKIVKFVPQASNTSSDRQSSPPASVVSVEPSKPVSAGSPPPHSVAVPLTSDNGVEQQQQGEKNSTSDEQVLLQSPAIDLSDGPASAESTPTDLEIRASPNKADEKRTLTERKSIQQTAEISKIDAESILSSLLSDVVVPETPAVRSLRRTLDDNSPTVEVPGRKRRRRKVNEPMDLEDMELSNEFRVALLRLHMDTLSKREKRVKTPPNEMTRKIPS